MIRVLILCMTLAGSIAASSSRAGSPDVRLHVIPATVYKVDDSGNAGTSSFVFDMAVICSSNCALSPIAVSIDLSNGRSTVERQEWRAEQLAKIKGMKHRISPDTPVESPLRMFALPEAFDLHFYFRLPQALAITSARMRVQVADEKGRRTEQALGIPIQYYRQKTSLIFPFHGRGVVGQDWATNGGHGGGIGTDFAVDVRGVDQNYAEQTNDADENASAVGWGREILAPAAGTVTYTRNDVPDNPRQGDPGSNVLAALPDPVMAFFGNSVVIDHGNDEFSLMAHMQYGSVMVKPGDRVAASQVIGRLGNSGNSFGPHLHYQLQSGPQPFQGQSLPFRFQGVDRPQLSRGMYFNSQ